MGRQLALDGGAFKRTLRWLRRGTADRSSATRARDTHSAAPRVAALFYGVIETCKLGDVDAYDYLRDGTHAGLEGQRIPLAGERDHSLV